METRWYLKHDGLNILVVVEERQAPWRGYCTIATNRRTARAALPVLRSLLAEATIPPALQIKTFDPVEVDERP
jgi:hypothetical protein